MVNYLEIGATIFGLIQGVLVMLNKRSNWIAYSMQMILMILFSLSMHLYGDVTNSAIYLVLGIIGFIIWNKKYEKGKPRGGSEVCGKCVVNLPCSFKRP